MFDNHKSISPEWRSKLFSLIENTPNLDWLLLTKRPQNIKKYYPEPAPNVWLGTSVEDQSQAEARIDHLVAVPAKAHFLSCEPLLGPVALERWKSSVDWVIVGVKTAECFDPWRQPGCERSRFLIHFDYTSRPTLYYE